MIDINHEWHRCGQSTFTEWRKVSALFAGRPGEIAHVTLSKIGRLERTRKRSATTQPSLVHKQSTRVVSATAVWPTNDLGPRIDRPPFVIPPRDISSFLVERRVILCGKGAEPGRVSRLSSSVRPRILERARFPRRTICIMVVQWNTWLVLGIPTRAKRFLLPFILLN